MNPAIALFLKRWWPALAGALVLVAILSLAYCKGQSAGRSGEVIKQQKREIEVQQDLGRANDKAGAQRLWRRVKISGRREGSMCLYPVGAR
jgi:hypothetical protein